RRHLAWADDTAADAVDAFLVVERHGHRYHAVLARIIGRAGQIRFELPGPGRHVDDEAVLARAHRGQHGMRAIERAIEIDGDDLIEAVGGEVLPEAVREIDAGAVDEDVDPSVPIEN